MTFSVDDYEKAIARIFNSQGYVIGTGFLVAPGYVLTCAHVVLQAIGIEKDDFSAYQEQPQETISLDFHILAKGKMITADVVGWLPYSLDEGDLAALKLKKPEPEGAKPIPLVEVSRAEVESEKHSVYGFGNSDGGGRSDAYRPKTQVAGGRFQLCKFDNPEDETIKGGFSGAPLWNQERECVIGMVATAQEQKSIAYAIPTQVLRPILKRIDAFRLKDVLIHSLEQCTDEEEKSRLADAIDKALRHTNPRGGESPWEEQLIELGVDRAPPIGWEAEGRLVQFAVMLARLDNTPNHTSENLEAWVEQCGLNFSDLFVRIDREMRQQRIPVSSDCDHLMVVVEPQETAPNEWRVSMWAVADRDTYDPNNPPQPLVSQEVILLKDLPEFIRETIRRKIGKKSPLIHFFVPRSLFDHDIEMQPIGTRRAVLGSKYPFVIRTNLKAHPIDRYYYDDWQDRWNQLMPNLENQTREVLQSVDCSLSEEDLMAFLEDEDINAATLMNCDSVGEFFELISEEVALPVALWSRSPQFQDNLNDILDCIVRTMPSRIQEERIAAHRSQRQQAQDPSQPSTQLGHHLSLVWEDPKIVPPDMQFDPEAC